MPDADRLGQTADYVYVGHRVAYPFQLTTVDAAVYSAPTRRPQPLSCRLHRASAVGLAPFKQPRDDT